MEASPDKGIHAMVCWFRFSGKALFEGSEVPSFQYPEVTNPIGVIEDLFQRQDYLDAAKADFRRDGQ
jgi:hypothetical protein